MLCLLCCAAVKYLRRHTRPGDLPLFLQQWREGALGDDRYVKSEEPPEVGAVCLGGWGVGGARV